MPRNEHLLAYCPAHAPAPLAPRLTRRAAQLLSAIEPLDRGAAASEDDIARVESLASAVERLNPNPRSLEAPEINGKWLLVYTTSRAILGTSRPQWFRPSGPIYQYIGALKG